MMDRYTVVSLPGRLGGREALHALMRGTRCIDSGTGEGARVRFEARAAIGNSNSSPRKRGERKEEVAA